MTTAVKVSRAGQHRHIAEALLCLHAHHGSDRDAPDVFDVLDFVWALPGIDLVASQLTQDERDELCEGNAPEAEEIAMRSVWHMALHYILQQEFNNHIDK